MRLQPGVTKVVAEQQLNELNVRLAAEHPHDFPKGHLRTVLLNYMDITQASGVNERELAPASCRGWTSFAHRLL
jgi:hypothetical protein